MKRFDDRSVKWMVEELEGRGYKVEPPKEETVDDLDFPVWLAAWDDGKANDALLYSIHEKTAANLWDNAKLVAPVEDVVRHFQERLDYNEIEKQNWWKTLNDDEEYINELF